MHHAFLAPFCCINRIQAPVRQPEPEPEPEFRPKQCSGRSLPGLHVGDGHGNPEAEKWPKFRLWMAPDGIFKLKKKY